MHLTVRVWRQAPAMRASRQWAPVFLRTAGGTGVRGDAEQSPSIEDSSRRPRARSQRPRCSTGGSGTTCGTKATRPSRATQLVRPPSVSPSVGLRMRSIVPSASRAAHGRTGTSNRSTASCGMNCWTGRSSTRSRKPRSWSRDGGGSTTRCGRTVRWAIDPQRLKRRCCTNRHGPARCSPTGSSPADAIRHWSAESGHPIEDLTAEDDFTPLLGWAPGAKTSADDGRVAEERVLHPALTMGP